METRATGHVQDEREWELADEELDRTPTTAEMICGRPARGCHAPQRLRGCVGRPR